MYFSFIVILGLGAAVDATDLGSLKEQYGALGARRDSLEVQRLLVAAEAEALSTRVDSLKLAEEDAEELQESLRLSLGLVQRMVRIDRLLAVLDARQDSLEERLRLGYDWEIGVLIQKLSIQSDRGLLTQLMVYQEAREQLGAEIYGASLRYGEQMKIGVDDGPDEIQQKLELMDDIAHRLQADLDAMAGVLQRLEAEYQLRSRMGSAAGEFQSYDSARKRVFVRGEHPGAQVRFRGEEEAAETELSPVDEVVLEIHKLKARRQEVRQLQSVVLDRAQAFRFYLRSLLEGEE